MSLLGRAGAPRTRRADHREGPAARLVLDASGAVERGRHRARVLRQSRHDALLIALAGLHGALLLLVPSAPLIAIALWWNANTIAHNFIHLPFFRSRRANLAFSAYLSLLLGLPQTLWRDRHLAHHADRPWRMRWSRRMIGEGTIVIGLWVVIAAQGPAFFFGTWLLGWLGGLALCSLQGRYEHARGTVSHYGPLYNLLFFNDGYHVEHHARPATHWTELPRRRAAEAERSRWPAVLRWLEGRPPPRDAACASDPAALRPWPGPARSATRRASAVAPTRLARIPLEALERFVLRSARLQRFVVDRHARAFERVVEQLPPLRRVAVIGGGLFPRTALVIRRIAPDAEIVIIDRSAENLRRARPYLDDRVRTVQASYAPELCGDADLLVVPLAFAGDRTRFYDDPPAPAVAVHDWIWRRRGDAGGRVVSLLLLKRLNLARAARV